MIRITVIGGYAGVEFPYDTQAVEIIKGIAGRSYDPTTKRWTIDADRVRIAATRFHNAGFTVTIDGKPFTPAAEPPPAGGTKSPLVALFAWLPDRLREPVYKALVRVLHPDVGGDTALMQQLNQARETQRSNP